MICVGLAPVNGNTACWAVTMYFMKLKIWSIFLQSHNPQRVCSFPLCKWVCRSYFWESMKAGQTFQECTYAVSSIGLAAEARLVANRGKRNIVNEQYNRFWKYDKASHAVVGTKGVLILSGLFSCWFWYQALLLENLNHHQQTVVISSSLKTSWSPLCLSILLSQLSFVRSHWKLLHWNWKRSK